jgi:hypothetical protein
MSRSKFSKSGKARPVVDGRGRAAAKMLQEVNIILGSKGADKGRKHATLGNPDSQSKPVMSG